MSKSIGAELPAEIYERLQARDLERYADKVILLATSDDRGWPHMAMLSYFEVVAKSNREIRLATYKDTTTTNNMRHNDKATLVIIDERLAVYIKGTVTEAAAQMKVAPENSKLIMKIERVIADEANEEYEPGAYVSSGVTYRDPNRSKQMLKAKEIIKELLE